MSDITDRLDALEAALKANQLPTTLAVLQRRLEQTWQPDAAVLLQSGSITPSLLSSDVPAFVAGTTPYKMQVFTIIAAVAAGFGNIAFTLPKPFATTFVGGHLTPVNGSVGGNVTPSFILVSDRLSGSAFFNSPSAQTLTLLITAYGN